MVDAGVPDYSLESAICKVSGTEFLWYAANRAMQLRGGEGYMRTDPYEKILRDIRIFPIFEGANDVLRAFIALTGIKPLGEELSGLGELGARRPDRIDRGPGRLRQRPDPARGPPGPDHPRPFARSPNRRTPSPTRSSGCATVTEKLLREHRKEIVQRQFQQKRLSAAVSDIYAQVALLSRVTSILEEQGVEPSGQEIYIADTFCTRAAGRVALVAAPDRVQRRRADDRDRQAGPEARRLRLRAVRGLSAGGRRTEQALSWTQPTRSRCVTSRTAVEICWGP